MNLPFRTRKSLFFITFFALTVYGDTPFFYRGKTFNKPSSFPLGDYTTTIDFTGMYGKSTKGWDKRGTKTDALNIYGDINFSTLGYNLENLSPSFKPLTYQYLRKSGGTIPSYNFTGNDGKVSLRGKFEIEEGELNVTQHLVKGFFTKISIPFKKIKSSDINYRNKTSSTNINYNNFNSFLTNTFDKVLAENGYEPLTKPFNKTGLGDVNCLVGWQASSSEAFGLIKEIRGMMSLGATLPTAPHFDNNIISELPFGNKGHFGIIAQAEGHIFIFDWLSLNEQISSTTFFSRSSTQRVVTYPEHEGPIALEKAHAKYNPGSLWTVQSTLGFHFFEKKIEFLLGHSLTIQEKNTIHIRDANYAKTFLTSEASDASIIQKSSQDSIANKDPKLHEWKSQSLHIALALDLQSLNYRCCPTISCFASIPLYGRLSLKTPFYGFGVGAKFKWNI